MTNREDVYSLVLEQFDGNEHKTKLWFKTPNPALGYDTPEEYIVKGRIKSLRYLLMKHLSKPKLKIQDQHTYSR